MEKPAIYSIGHSNRTIEEFIGLLKAHGVRQLADVRTIPKSRHNPQFNQEELKQSLAGAGISYRHMKAVGGLRKPLKGSVNTGWRHSGFRGYADYMQTEEFSRGLQKLEEVARKKPTAMMCAEALPWRCHRSLLSDALIKHGWQVLDIMSRRTARVHKLTPFLKVRKGTLTYPEPKPAAGEG